MCRASGFRWKHPYQLLQDYTADEWLDLLAYYIHQPWGETRADMRNVALLLNMAAPFAEITAPSMLHPYDTDRGEAIDSEATIDAIQSLGEALYGNHANNGDTSNTEGV